jgi:hypothetical protein
VIRKTRANPAVTGAKIGTPLKIAYSGARRTAFRGEAEQDSGPVPNSDRSVATLAF